MKERVSSRHRKVATAQFMNSPGFVGRSGSSGSRLRQASAGDLHGGDRGSLDLVVG
jgi:hypothetical protein